MNTNDYISEAFRELSDTNFHQILDTDLIPKISLQIDFPNSTRHEKKNKEIDKKWLAYLLSSNPRPGQFYLLPKIHKGVITMAGLWRVI